MKRLSEIAKDHKVLPSQIRYYIKFGLLTPSHKTQGGFYLFDDTDEKIVNKIFELKETGMELNEIKGKLTEVMTNE